MAQLDAPFADPAFSDESQVSKSFYSSPSEHEDLHKLGPLNHVSHICNLPKTLEQLVATNNVLNDVVVELRDILRDPSRHSEYPLFWLRRRLRKSSEDEMLVNESSDAGSGSTTVEGWADAEDLVGNSLLDEIDRNNKWADKERRRAQKKTKREYLLWGISLRTSQGLQSTIWSYLPTSDYVKMYGNLDKSRLSWQTAPRFARGRDLPLDLDDMLTELFGSVFRETILAPWKVPLEEAEYSFELTFEVILNKFLERLPLLQETGCQEGPYRAKWNDFRMWAPIFNEVGRFFNDMRREKDVTSNRFAFSLLLQRCEDRGLCKEYLDLRDRSDWAAGTHIPTQIVWGALIDMNHMRRLPYYIPGPPCTASDLHDIHILGLLARQYGMTPMKKYERARWRGDRADSWHFDISGLCSRSLKELGGLDIAWTDEFCEHLRISTTSKTLTLFWSAGLFWYPHFWPRLPLSFRTSYEWKPWGERLNCFEELKKTYAIIFNNTQAQGDRDFIKHRVEHKLQDDAGIQLSELVYRDTGWRPHRGQPLRPFPRVRTSITHPQVQRILKPYLETPLPRSLDRILGQEDDPTAPSVVKKVTSIGDLLKTKRPPTLDIWVHIESILERSPRGTQNVADYPFFGARLRDLYEYMDQQQPRSLEKLWKDRRNTVGYVTLWAVIVMGGVTILLALVSIAVSSAQAAAAFEALKSSG